MASTIDQIGTALAGAHSAAYNQLKADIEAHIATEAAQAATIADLTAKLAAAGALVGTPDVDLEALDALLNPPAPAPVAPPAAPAEPEPAAS